VCRDAQDEDSKTTLLSEATSVDIKTSQLLSYSATATKDESTITSNGNVIIETYLDESSPSTSTTFDARLLSSTNVSAEMKTEPIDSSCIMRVGGVGVKRNPLDLSPENFFMTSTEMNGTYPNAHYPCTLFYRFAN
jgi:hypothetical protein